MLEIRKKRVGTSTLKYKFVKICANLWLIQAATNHTNFHEYFFVVESVCPPQSNEETSVRFPTIKAIPSDQWNLCEPPQNNEET